MSTNDETIEDVRAAYALLFRDMAALRVKADALLNAAQIVNGTLPHINGNASSVASLLKLTSAAIANYTGA